MSAKDKTMLDKFAVDSGSEPGNIVWFKADPKDVPGSLKALLAKVAADEVVEEIKK